MLISNMLAFLFTQISQILDAGLKMSLGTT